MTEINDNYDEINAPQVKIGADGNLIIDDESLYVRTKAPDKLNNNSEFF